MSNQGTIRLKVTNGAPAIEKLWNGRFKLEFFCDNNSPKEDWYYENVSALLPEYGILQTTNFGSGVSEDWEAIPDSVYPDMRLVLAEYPYNVRAGKHYVKLTYETLTASWVEAKAEDADYELNGLKRVSRTFVALPATAYDKVVGTSTIDSGGTTLYLGSFKIEKTEAKWGLTEVWLEAGTLSETLDSVGSQKAKVIETIGADPDTPTGYSLASKQESDFEGFQTNRFTFLKNDVQLSKSEDEVGSENAITEEWFNPDPANTRNVKTNYSLARKEESDVDGIPTKRFTFLKDNVELSRSEDLVGSQKAIVTEVFKPAADPTETGYVIARTEVSDVDGIPTKRFTFLRDGAVMSESRTSESDGVFKVTKVFFNNAGVTVGPIIAQRTDDVDGIPTISITTLQDVDGNSIVAGGENLVNQVSGFSPFSYPGVLDVIANQTTNGGGGGWLQVKALLIDAPAQCKVKTTTYFIFQTANSIVASDYKYASSTGLWSPNHWAAFSISASGVSGGGLFSDSSTFRGYRTSSPSHSGSLSGPSLSVAQLSWQGRSVLTDNTMIIYNLVVDQGPPNPIGNTYTLDVQITPAFDDIDGNQYYKKTIVVTDAIPSQPNTASLPYA